MGPATTIQYKPNTTQLYTIQTVSGSGVNPHPDPPPQSGPGSRGTHHGQVLEPAELRAAVSPTQFEEEEQGGDDGGDDEGRHQAGQQRVQLRGLVKDGGCNAKRTPEVT